MSLWQRSRILKVALCSCIASVGACSHKPQLSLPWSFPSEDTLARVATRSPKGSSNEVRDQKGAFAEAIRGWRDTGLRKLGVNAITMHVNNANTMHVNAAEGKPLVLIEDYSFQVCWYRGILLLDRGENIGGVAIFVDYTPIHAEEYPDRYYAQTMVFGVDKSDMHLARKATRASLVGYARDIIHGGASFVTVWREGQRHTIGATGLATVCDLEEGSATMRNRNPPHAVPLAELISRVYTIVAKEREAEGMTPF